MATVSKKGDKPTVAFSDSPHHQQPDKSATIQSAKGVQQPVKDVTTPTSLVNGKLNRMSLAPQTPPSPATAVSEEKQAQPISGKSSAVAVPGAQAGTEDILYDMSDVQPRGPPPDVRKDAVAMGIPIPRGNSNTNIHQNMNSNTRYMASEVADDATTSSRLSAQVLSPSPMGGSLPLPMAPSPMVAGGSVGGTGHAGGHGGGLTMTMAQRLLARHAMNVQFAERYHITCELGTGGFGFVCGARRILDDKEVAVKFILKSKVPSSSWVRDKDYGVIPMEVYILKSVNHPNIIAFLDCYDDEKYVYLVTELHGSQWSGPDSSRFDSSMSNDPPHQEMTIKNALAGPPSAPRMIPGQSQGHSQGHRQSHAQDSVSDADPRNRKNLGTSGSDDTLSSSPGTPTSMSSAKYMADRHGGVPFSSTPPNSSISMLSTSPNGLRRPVGAARAAEPPYSSSPPAQSHPHSLPGHMITGHSGSMSSVPQGGLAMTHSPMMSTSSPFGLAGGSSANSGVMLPPGLARANTFPLMARLIRRPSMDLFECIEHHDWLPEEKARLVFRQVASAVCYLHGRGVVHRDIKDENIVIDNFFNVRLIDFGSATVEPRGNPNHLFDRFYGTIQYASPEILRGEKYRGRPTDIWALGVLLYTILFGEVPFSSSDQAMLAMYKPPRFRSNADAMMLLDWMLDKDPKRRPTAEEVLRHPWMRHSSSSTSLASLVDDVEHRQTYTEQSIRDHLESCRSNHIVDVDLVKSTDFAASVNHHNALNTLPTTIPTNPRAGLACILLTPENLEECQLVIDFANKIKLSFAFSSSESSTTATTIPPSLRSPPIRLLPCAGLHPVQKDPVTGNPISATLKDLPPILSFIESRASEIVAVGEIGLDFSPWVLKGSVESSKRKWEEWKKRRDRIGNGEEHEGENDDEEPKIETEESVKAMQIQVLTAQANLAATLGLPINVHSRNAGHHAIKVLSEVFLPSDTSNSDRKPVSILTRTLLHAFDGASKHAVRASTLGAYLSVPGSIRRDPSTQKWVQAVPLSNLVLESDSPALAVLPGEGPGKPRVGWPGESVLVSCQEIARLKGVSVEEVARITFENSVKLFGKRLQG
ncbi:hypothetical protein HDU76_005859 [Blyttiomyces sp. JEL0837]|nr:hypothetical protein HDU76_005859 [Blyttiomyces sp. JEL0837]